MPDEEKDERLDRELIEFTAFLGISIAGAVFVVTDIISDTTIAALIAAGTAAFFGWFWYALPLLRRAQT